MLLIELSHFLLISTSSLPVLIVSIFPLSSAFRSFSFHLCYLASFPQFFLPLYPLLQSPSVHSFALQPCLLTTALSFVYLTIPCLQFPWCSNMAQTFTDELIRFWLPEVEGQGHCDFTSACERDISGTLRVNFFKCGRNKNKMIRFNNWLLTMTKFYTKWAEFTDLLCCWVECVCVKNPCFTI